MRRSIAALCLVAVALLPACSRNKPPNSLFDTAGYHVRGDKVYYLAAFPGQAYEITGADPASFKSFDTSYAKDEARVYFDGHPISGADATSFEPLERNGFGKDRNHVYQLDRPISDDPAHFELLDGGLSKDSAAVYWTDGDVLSKDPSHFAIVSTNEHYLFTKDSRTVHVNGNPIADADPATFRVLQDVNAAFEFSADAQRAYYRKGVIATADPRTFPPDRAVTNCTETSVSFEE